MAGVPQEGHVIWLAISWIFLQNKIPRPCRARRNPLCRPLNLGPCHLPPCAAASGPSPLIGRAVGVHWHPLHCPHSGHEAGGWTSGWLAGDRRPQLQPGVGRWRVSCILAPGERASVARANKVPAGLTAFAKIQPLTGHTCVHAGAQSPTPSVGGGAVLQADWATLPFFLRQVA